jgi:D-tyrosyl-tRNA(Tyr) deacylase
MIALIQKVKNAQVDIDNKLYSKINQGILLFLGIHKRDIKEDAQYLVKKIIQTRIFYDSNNKMNLDIQKTKGSILVVSQFTLYGNLKRGNRPSFINSASHEVAEPLYNYFISLLKEYDITIETGKFRSMMNVNLTNDGPVTLIIESRNG